jgi:ribosomal protein L4
MDNSLVIIGDAANNVELAARNHAKSKLLDVRGLNVYDILKYKGLVIDLKAVELIQERLKP